MDVCPHVAFEPLGESYRSDPYPMLAELREHSPVFYAADLGMWVISRHHDVEEVFRDAYEKQSWAALRREMFGVNNK